MIHSILDSTTTIVAPATAEGGAVMVIRLSGEDAISIADAMFRGRTPLADAEGYTLHYGRIVDGERVVDDVVVALFRAPHSYTGDDTVEITIHGSKYISQEVIRLAVKHGARVATAGEFTRRSFLAGKMDLSRAEAVADIISSDTEWSHDVASRQMRGGYSCRLASLREQLLRLCSLLELELDFSEEDVEFADRKELEQIVEDVATQLRSLVESFRLGNVLKNGVMVAIVGEPNVGKSTLLNALVEEDRAMVSDVAGTTRDTVEATTVIDGVRFRFVDTAGLHSTDDRLEQMGIERTQRAMDEAHIVLHIASAERPIFSAVMPKSGQHYVRVINKIDKVSTCESADAHLMSAKNGIGVEELKALLRSTVDTATLNRSDVLVTNMRHYEALHRALEALGDVERALCHGLSGDLLSEDLRRVLHHLGEITGEVTSDDILHNIFSKFCIGK